MIRSLSKDDLLYQTENEITPESLHNTAQQQKALGEEELNRYSRTWEEKWLDEDDLIGAGMSIGAPVDDLINAAGLSSLDREMTRIEAKLDWLAKAEDARGAEEAAEEAPLRDLRAGDCLIFDDRLLHRGGANASDSDRWVAYFSYMRPRRPGLLGEVDGTHFEATRSLFS